MGVNINTTVDIEANAQAVWRVLTDFPRYGDWNPFMDRIEGAPEVGRKLVVHMTPKNGRSITFKPTVIAAMPAQQLRWLGKLGFGGLFDGEHYFLLTPNPDGSTRLTHGEQFSGILVQLLKGTMKNTDAGFADFNDALKHRVETTATMR